MYKCPHCGKNTISMWAKVKSRSIHPASCSMCGEQSFMQGNRSIWPAMVGVFGVPLVLILAFSIKSWTVVAAGALVLSVGLFLSIHNSRLVKANVFKAKRQHWYVFIILVGALAWFVYDGFVK